MGFLRRIFGRDIETDTSVQNGYTLVADDTKTSGIDWSDVLVRGGLGRDLADGINYAADIDGTVTPGKYSFDGSTVGDIPGTAGNFEVRERDTTIFQVAQTDDNKLFSRSKIGVGAWSAWAEYATETYVDNSIRKVFVDQTVIMGPVAGSSAIQYTYTIDEWDLSVHLRLISPGGGGGGGGGTDNNGDDDYGAVGGAGGSSGSVVAMSLTGFPPGTLIQVGLGAAGSGGTKGLNISPGGTPGGAGGDGQACTIRVQQPGMAVRALDVTIPGGKGGPGGTRGGINSCTSTPASGVPNPVVTSINRNLVHISTYTGAAGSGVICSGGGGGIPGGSGGVLSIISDAAYNTPASGGAGVWGGNGQPGASGQVAYAPPFNFGKGGGGGGGAHRGQNFGGSGGSGGSGGLFIAVTKLVL